MKHRREIGVGVAVAVAAYGLSVLGALGYVWLASRDVGADLPVVGDEDETDDEEPESLYVHLTDRPATDGVGFMVVDDDDEARQLIERLQDCAVGAPLS